MAVNEPTYQFALTAKECEFIRAIRSVEKSITPTKQTRLHQTLELHVREQDGDSLGSCEVSPENMVMDFVGAAAAFLTELMKDPVELKKGSTEFDEGVHIDDCDSVLGSQTQNTSDDLTEPDAGVKTVSWESIRKTRIPSCVKEISFTVNDEDLVPELREQLQSNYSGVTILTPGMIAEKERASQALAKRRPNGIKQMIIELEENETTQNPELESSLRREYPWAMIRSKPDPNTSRKHARRLTESDAATPRRPDPVKHIEDFSAYLMDPPSDDEFGYNYPIGEGWDRLSYPRKFEIAHARAIQHYHGKVADGVGCGYCASHGYQCKVYPPPLANLAHMALGHSCQHCRLRQIQCDLPAATRDPPSTPTAPKALNLDTHNPLLRGEAGNMSPPTITTPRSLASRITGPNQIRPDGREDDDTYDNTPVRISPDMSFMEAADLLGLFPDSHPKVRNVIFSMYSLLRDKKLVEPFGKYPLTLDRYYENLITLYILTYRREEYDLAFVVLLRFQNTNYQEKTDVPTINNVVRAFQHLPSHAPLCRWIVIVYSFLWDTVGQGHWDLFLNTNPDVRPPPKFRALTKLLYGICYIRDPYTTGGDIAVRKRWCNVHNHRAGLPGEKRACESMIAEYEDSAKEAERSWKESEIQQAKDTLALLEHGHGSGDAAGPSTPRFGEKRKAENSPMLRPFKAARGGRGRGRPRGPSR